MNTVDNILAGKLELPEQIVELSGSLYKAEMESMFQALWYNYCLNKSGISLTYWSDKFNNSMVFNRFLKHLSKAGWITTNVEPQRNWAEAYFNENKLNKWVTPAQVIQMRKTKKYIKYMPTTSKSSSATKVKTAEGIKKTGIVREGFAKAGNHKFSYDRVMLNKYRTAILLNTTKAIDKLKLKYDIFKDNVDYASVSITIVDSIISNNQTFTTGECIMDSRGRAIKSILNKVFNPIAFKDARALLIGPSVSLDYKALKHIHLAIAELLDLKATTIQDRTKLGRQAYLDKKLLVLDLSKEKDRAKLYENIWLERIYHNLDIYDGKNWTVPIEKDFTASMLAIEGLLLNHEPYLKGTNIIGNTINDIWYCEGIPRKQYKKAATPILYGSSRNCTELWSNSKIKYTRTQVIKFTKEIETGKLAVANKFKEFIVNNVKPQEVMKVKIWDEEFTISCNRHRIIGDYTKKYDIYSSKSDTVLSIYHTHTKTVPDLEQFRRYFPTLLMHNLDSQLANRLMLQLAWGIDIHDAFIVMPNEAESLGTLAVNVMQEIYDNRDTIKRNFFESIGIDSKSAVEWSKLQDKIQEPKEKIKIQATVLK